MNFEEFRENIDKIMHNGKASYISDKDLKYFSDFLREKLSNEEPLKIYRYMPINYDNVRNLEKEQLYLSTNGIMNDIYEGIPKNEDTAYSLKGIKYFDRIMMMKCFSESYDSELMWGHYADGHRGFCVGYNLQMLKNDENVLGHIYPVVYTDKRYAEINESEFEKDAEIFFNRGKEEGFGEDELPYLNDITALFLTKGEKWSYEKEWRILYSVYDVFQNGPYELEKVPILPFRCTSDVYFGMNTEERYKEHIVEIVERLNKQKDAGKEKIKIFEPYMDKDSYTIKFRERK